VESESPKNLSETARLRASSLDAPISHPHVLKLQLQIWNEKIPVSRDLFS